MRDYEMQSGIYWIKDYINYTLKFLKNTKKYEKVFYVPIGLGVLSDTDYFLGKITEEINKTPKIKKNFCILLKTEEPLTYVPTSKISLEILDLINSLKKFNIFSCDFFIVNFLRTGVAHQVDFLNENSYGWKFVLIETNCVGLTYYPDSLFDALEKNKHLNFDKCKFNLSHLNFTTRTHRELFSKFLIKENIIKDNLIAINTKNRNEIGFNWPAMEQYKNDIRVQHNTSIQPVKESKINFSSYECWFLNKKFLSLMDNTKLVSSVHPNINNHYDYIHLDFLYESILNVVSESVYYYPYVDLGEKVVQPILVKRPFVLIAPPHSLKYLQSIGYRTFGKYIDESYDSIEDPNLRMEKVMQVVKDFNNQSVDENKKTLVEMEDDLLHNYFLMLSQIKNLQKTIGKCIIKYVNNRKNIN